MKIQAINRATQLRKGKSVVRTYHNCQNMSRVYTAFAGLELVLALGAANLKQTFNTILTTGLTMLFTKKAVDFHNLKVDLWYRYQEVVARAQSIKQKQGLKK